MPCTETPTIRRVPCPEATARAWSVEISCVRMPDAGAGRHSGKRAAIVTCTRRACARSRTRSATSWASRSARQPAAPTTASRTTSRTTSSKRGVCADDPESGSTTQSMRAGNGCAELSSTPRRTIVSTPVSPTRDGDTALGSTARRAP